MGYNTTMATHREISVSLPELLLARLDIHFYDPSMDKPAYGSRSRLITELLEEWLGKHNTTTTG